QCTSIPVPDCADGQVLTSKNGVLSCTAQQQAALPNCADDEVITVHNGVASCAPGPGKPCKVALFHVPGNSVEGSYGIERVLDENATDNGTHPADQWGNTHGYVGIVPSMFMNPGDTGTDGGASPSVQCVNGKWGYTGYDAYKAYYK